MTTAARRTPVPGGLATSAAFAWRLLLVVAAALVLGYLLLTLRLVVIPLVLGAAIAALLYRQVDWLGRHRLPRSLASLLVTLGWTFGLIGALVLVGMTVFDEVDELVAGVEGGLEQLRDYLAGFGIDALQLSELQDSASRALQDNQQSLTTGVVSGATIVAETLAGFFLFVVVLFFLLRDGRSIWSWTLDRLPADKREQVDAGGRAALSSLASYLRGTAIIATVDAVLIGIALAVLGVPLVVPLAVLVFLGAFIPVVGSSLAGAVAVLVALVAQGPLTAGLALIAVVVIQQVEGDVLAPIVFGRALSLHPLVVVVALTGGAVIGGILGAAASVPLVAAGWAVIRAVRPEVSSGQAPQDEERAPV
ncbi:MAG: AI-2E family transporter [Frankiaceae bacterium]|nr:AI-2E family transporter [Frankiaceae bacterium]